MVKEGMVDSLLDDVRVILRSLKNNPGFAVTAILTTAMAVGINTAMFTVVHATLLAPLPYPQASRLTYIWKDLTSAAYQRAPLAAPELIDLRRAASQYEQIGGILAVTGTLVDEGRPQSVRIGLVSTNFLSVFGVAPFRGRALTADDGRMGSAPSLIISGELHQGRFNGGEVIGRRVRVDGGWGGLRSGTYTIVGVMPVGFEMLLPPDSRVPRRVDGWIPFQYDLSTAPRALSFLSSIGRLAPNATFADAQAQLEAVSQSAQYASSGRRFYAIPLDADLAREARPALIVLQSAVGLVLLVGCASIAALQLARAQARRREVGIRAALGASGGRLARLLLTEGVVLALIGGVLGMALAIAGVRLLPMLDIAALPRGDALPLNRSVLAFSVFATFVSALLFGAVPLIEWRGRKRLVITLAGRDSSLPPPRARRMLVVAEVALSVVLLIGAGLLGRTFLNMLAIDPGYASDDVLTFQLTLPLERYGSVPALARFTRQIEDAMHAIPGVTSAGVVNQVPLDNSVPNGSSGYWTRETAEKRDPPIVDSRLVTPGYLAALGIRVVSGRSFTTADDETQPLVLMVDETLAQRAWPGRDAIGQELGLQLWSPAGFQLRWGRVVGVVHPVRHHRLTADVREEVFVPFAQAPRTQMAVVVRSAVDTDTIVSNVSTQLHTIDRDLAPARVQRLDRLVERSRAPARLSVLLATLFAGLSLLLTCIGLYGVVSYTVTQRTQEIGVRAALGATNGQLIQLVLRHGLTLTAIGLVIGLAGSIAVARWLTTLLYGVTAYDPLVYITVSFALALTALLAAYAPARHATRIDPKLALRGE
jgi:putative ABC transport system permease protein